jgi:hypothetical protein
VGNGVGCRGDFISYEKLEIKEYFFDPDYRRV